MIEMGGEWQARETRNWEPYSAVRKRVTAVLEQYTHYETALVVCHAAVIQALAGEVVDMAEYIGYAMP